MWRGKSFFEVESIGRNRFEGDSLDHTFDYSLEGSALDDGYSCVLRYRRHHSRLSLWRSMRDELRVLSLTDGDVLIGMGSMTWSGGSLNASPFCLWRVQEAEALE